MPFKRGPGTYKGFQSPNTRGWSRPVRMHVRRVYGAYRQKNPGESRAVKTRGSRIAWASARRKFPQEFSRHERIQRGAKIEKKEHPWASEKTATRIATNHVDENPRAYPKRSEKRTEAIRARIRAAQISED